METSPGSGRALPKNSNAESFAPPSGTPIQLGAPYADVTAKLNPPLGAPVFIGNHAPSPTNARPVPLVGLSDVVYAVFLLIIGTCFWSWQILNMNGSMGARGIGTTLFFCLPLGATCFYLHAKGIRQTKGSAVLLGIALLAAVPFALYGAREIDGSLLLFEGCLCLLWLAYSCKALIVNKLTALLAFDLITQTLITPFANFGQLFSRSYLALKDKRGWRQMLPAVAGLLVSLPLIALVFNLLVGADEGFRQFTLELQDAFDLQYLVDQGFNFLLGIPLACYVFGAVAGNAFKRYSPFLSREPLERAFLRAHMLPRVALYGLLLALIAIYAAFFIVLGSYHFSALQGNLPTDYTYAEYARRGFFELCGVAAINLFVVGLTWTLAKRAGEERPVFLRVLTGGIAGLTCLLVVTAASKMWLYIEAYGLTQLRFYTSWFIILLLVLFLVVLLWHIRPFNVARPLTVAVIALVFALAWTNVDGIIARYNVDRYLQGQTEHIDTDTLMILSDAAVPALRDLEEQANDEEVVLGAQGALRLHHDRHIDAEGESGFWDSWYYTNLMSLSAWNET